MVEAFWKRSLQMVCAIRVGDPIVFASENDFLTC